MHRAVMIACICPGGCQLALHGDKLYLYSGHTVTVDKEDRSETDTVHDDLWCLDINTFVVRSTILSLIVHTVQHCPGLRQ